MKIFFILFGYALLAALLVLAIYRISLNENDYRNECHAKGGIPSTEWSNNCAFPALKEDSE